MHIYIYLFIVDPRLTQVGPLPVQHRDFLCNVRECIYIHINLYFLLLLHLIIIITHVDEPGILYHYYNPI